ncbi:uncharacterized protein [Rutidosis leptorrhynchoides]|uniref:uncharacterized protein n=1 Tax=Rutidosis leptorrhynchoides TaxID=125765 RepID=UPI003A992B59
MSSRWVTDMEACFRTTRCLDELKTTFGTSMFRGVAQRWWNDMLAINGNDYPDKITWEEFKTEFFKNFRSESEVERLKTELQNTRQGSMDLITFRTHFIDRLQFSPEYINNEMSKCRLFHGLLRNEIRKRIIISQFRSFTALFDAARDIEDEIKRESIAMQKKESFNSKRKVEQSNSPQKKGKFSSDGKKGGNSTPPRVCFTCERKEEERKEVVRKLERSAGAPKGRSFQMTVDEARKSSEVVSGTFLVNSIPAKVMFDSGADRSFVATRFAPRLCKVLSTLKSPLEVEIADDKTKLVVGVYKNCNLDINSVMYNVDLIPMAMGEFDVIVGMDWLSRNRANISVMKRLFG